ncbi:hypothetical protein C6N75_16460 [Streptomyces solincola]|uniref:Transmembrane protein n=2 Tax=Streptomyces solincola TaxID=2100817 RepID=A0A2S9PUQ4_9ACTN|nr:hypothetical protein C6N75_16460 [Streptomyces solincola]
MPSSSIDEPVESEWGGRVAMEAGPRDREERQTASPPEDVRVGVAPGAPLAPPGLTPDGPDLDEDGRPRIAPDEVEVELRPQRKLRIWQLAPIVGLAVIGSLMFGFPLAFGSGDGGAVLAMLGLLLCGCAAGWGLMAARRVGYTWPGLPARGSGERPDWRVLALYAAGVAIPVMLAVWRVARLR